MIYFLIYLFLEVMLSVYIASLIGGLATFIEIVLTAFIGVYILLRFQDKLSENMKRFSMQQMDIRQMQELNLFTLFGSILLIIPGFLTDILGVLIQFAIITQPFVNKYGKKYDSNHVSNSTKKDENVIDVEIISDSSDSR